MTTTTTTPLRHVHGHRDVAGPAEQVAEQLRLHGDRLAAAATANAFETLAATIATGGFRRPVPPRVTTSRPDDALAPLRVLWNDRAIDRWPPRTAFAGRPTSPWWRSDEEETGWPSATIDVLVTSTDGGARLTALVDRTPGYDTSTNRIDKQVRDRLARAAIDGFLDGLAALLDRGGR
jgi:hypothetical protein